MYQGEEKGMDCFFAEFKQILQDRLCAKAMAMGRGSRDDIGWNKYFGARNFAVICIVVGLEY